MVARLDGLSLSRLRLAASPVAEATHWMRVALTRSGHPVHGDPGPVARAALRHPDTALVAQLLTPVGQPGYMPDLLTPKPESGPSATVLERQFAAIAATPAEQVSAQVAARYGRRPVPPTVRAAVADGALATRVAAGLRRFWQEALAERWPQVRTLLDAELAERATRMAAGGVGSLLDDLHPTIHWTAGTLTVESRFRTETTLSDTEVVVTPSVLAWPQVTVQLCDARDAVLTYPAAGPPPSGRRGRLGDLVGVSRADILADLDVPRSTGELSRRHHLAPATVSYHLGVLLRSGLVRRRRDRHLVLYQRSTSGDSLVDRPLVGV
ncbi:DUF5937 family protein [Micromonospora sp. WMMD1128]|uniref:DUF5937 family protein n=1 Tax=Micromonospora sp. WMMD1128 TaxID=3015150 RepID=UPI00248C1AFF|nr:DUF5937 family protein [Micromonospora sp. WMMD1128]WBB77146.1 DUF5937 family protein [Micromonospora sp. WMMD1128]